MTTINAPAATFITAYTGNGVCQIGAGDLDDAAICVSGDAVTALFTIESVGTAGDLGGWDDLCRDCAAAVIAMLQSPDGMAALAADTAMHAKAA